MEGRLAPLAREHDDSGYGERRMIRTRTDISPEKSVDTVPTCTPWTSASTLATLAAAAPSDRSAASEAARVEERRPSASPRAREATSDLSSATPAAATSASERADAIRSASLWTTSKATRTAEAESALMRTWTACRGEGRKRPSSSPQVRGRSRATYKIEERFITLSHSLSSPPPGVTYRRLRLPGSFGRWSRGSCPPASAILRGQAAVPRALTTELHHHKLRGTVSYQLEVGYQSCTGRERSKVGVRRKQPRSSALIRTHRTPAGHAPQH